MENGCFQVSGRIKDIINRGGEKIQPKEVEELLIRHPEIISVQVGIAFYVCKMHSLKSLVEKSIIHYPTQVYGINDARLGEAVTAAIVKKPDSKLTEQDVKEYCQHKVTILLFYKVKFWYKFSKM